MLSHDQCKDHISGQILHTGDAIRFYTMNNNLKSLPGQQVSTLFLPMMPAGCNSTDGNNLLIFFEMAVMRRAAPLR